MSRWPDRIVRLAARTLPPTIRDRYREEWTGDVADARDAGIRPSSVAVGALVFSVTLDRDAPEIAGEPIPAIAMRHARWALALTAAATTVALNRFLVESVWLPIVVVLILATIVHLWAAAHLTSGVARLSATLATAAFAIFVAGSTIPAFISDAIPFSQFFLFFATLMLIAAIVIGLFAWGVSGSAAAPDNSRNGIRPWLVLVLALAGIAVFTAAQYLNWSPLLIAAQVAAVAVALRIKSHRAATPPTQERSAKPAILVAAALMFGLIAFGAIDALVWSPQWAAGSFSVDEILATLTDAQRAEGVGNIVLWIALSTVAVIAYLSIGLRLAEQTRPGDLWLASLFAIALTGVILAYLPWAQNSLLTDMFAMVSAGFTPVPALRLVHIVISQVALLIALVAWISPRKRKSPEPSPAT